MISGINSSIGFMGLPKYLQRAKVESLNAQGLTDIIRDAGNKAGIVIKTSSSKVLKNNEHIFNSAGQITPEGAKELADSYRLKKGTCTELRDVLAEGYKGYKGDGILDQIV